MADAYSDDDMEDLEANVAVMLMADMQELHMTDTCLVYDTDGLSQVPDSTTCLINEIISSSASASKEESNVQNDSFLSSHEDEQLNTTVTFDDDDLISPVDSNDHPILNDNDAQLDDHLSS